MRVVLMSHDVTSPEHEIVCQTLQALIRAKVKASLASGAIPQYTSLVHLWGCDTPGAIDNWRRVMAWGGPYIVSPVFRPRRQDVPRGITRVLLSNASAVQALGVMESLRLERELPEDDRWPMPRTWECLAPGSDPGGHLKIDHGMRNSMTAIWWGRADSSMKPKVSRICHEHKIPVCHVAGGPALRLNAYRVARLVLDIDLADVAGVATYEALGAGCRVISGNHHWTNGWIPKLDIVDPEDIVGVENAVNVAYHTRSWSTDPIKAVRMRTWDVVAQEQIEIYKGAIHGRTLGNNPDKGHKRAAAGGNTVAG